MTDKREKEQTPGPPGAEILEQVFRCNAALYGFDIWSFDEWLAAMEDCGAKKELTERRQWAREAIQIGAINTDALLRHLEWMMLRWKYIERTDFLVPLARAGKAIDDGRRKPKRPELQAWIDTQVSRATGETARHLWNRAPDWITDPDDGIGFDRFTKRITASRKRAGVGRK